MTTTNDNIRQAHKLLDYVAEGRAVLDEEVGLLRSFLPELPKQMSLKEIYEFVDNAAYGTRDNMWRDDVHGELETWLHELSSQLKGLIDAKPSHPEFLETEEDYKNAPEGTVVSADGSITPRVRTFDWPIHMTFIRRQVLRWGWGE